MINKNNDSKFIIYQVLYIFVITVLALKGAELDLSRVVSKEKVENEVLKEKLTKMNKQLASLTTKLNEIPTEVKQEKEPEIIDNTKLQSPLSVSQTFIQNTWNEVKNNGDVTTIVYDSRSTSSPIVTIQAGEKRKFDLTDQTDLIIKFGTQEGRGKVLL